MHNKCLLAIDITDMQMQVRVAKDISFWTRIILYLPCNMDGSSSPLIPITLILILCLSSIVKSPSHILLSILPYSGTSLKRCLLSKIMMALIFWSHCWVDLLENKSSDSFEQIGSSWRKSPAKMIENPPNNLVLFLICVSCLLSYFQNTITHEWYLINHKNSYILPFIYVDFLKFSLQMEISSLWNCDTIY